MSPNERHRERPLCERQPALPGEVSGLAAAAAAHQRVIMIRLGAAIVDFSTHSAANSESERRPNQSAYLALFH